MRASRCGLLLLGLTAANLFEESLAAGPDLSGAFDSPDDLDNLDEEEEVPPFEGDPDLQSNPELQSDPESDPESDPDHDPYLESRTSELDLEAEPAPASVEPEEEGAAAAVASGVSVEGEDEPAANEPMLSSLIPPSLKSRFTSTLRTSQRLSGLNEDEIAPLMVLAGLFGLALFGGVSLFKKTRDRPVTLKDSALLDADADKMIVTFEQKVKEFKYKEGKQGPSYDLNFSYGGVNYKASLRVSDPRGRDGGALASDYVMVKDMIRSDLHKHCDRLRNELRSYGISESKYGDSVSSYGGGDTLFRLTVVRR